MWTTFSCGGFFIFFHFDMFPATLIRNFLSLREGRRMFTKKEGQKTTTTTTTIYNHHSKFVRLVAFVENNKFPYRLQRLDHEHSSAFYRKLFICQED